MSAKRCSRKISGADLPGVEGAGGAEVTRGMGAVGTQAQVGKIGEGKGSSQDFTRVGAVIGWRWFCWCHTRFLLLFLLALFWRVTWMKQCPRPRPPGSLRIRELEALCSFPPGVFFRSGAPPAKASTDPGPLSLPHPDPCISVVTEFAVPLLRSTIVAHAVNALAINVCGRRNSGASFFWQSQCDTR